MKKHLMTIVYVVVITIVLITAYQVRAIDQERSHEKEVKLFLLCEGQNQNLEILEAILLSLVEPRPDDEPGEYEERQALFDSLAHLLEPRDCPPDPDEPEEFIDEDSLASLIDSL